MKLREIAHSRTGDKGNTSNISVIAYEAKHYPLLLRAVTSERVKAHFAGVVEGDVVRYELPNISALNFVMTGTLGGGVTRPSHSMRMANLSVRPCSIWKSRHRWIHKSSCPGLVPGIHVLVGAHLRKNVDGRDRPGHDEESGR